MGVKPLTKEPRDRGVQCYYTIGTISAPYRKCNNLFKNNPFYSYIVGGREGKEKEGLYTSK